MLKRLIFILLANLCLVSAFADEVQKFEAELNVGLALPYGGFNGGQKRISPNIGIELRYNLPNKNFDFGLLVKRSKSNYTFKDNINPEIKYQYMNISTSYLITCDYNFKQGQKFNPFVGLGAGVATHDTFLDANGNEVSSSPSFMPRVGIEMFSHLRVSLNAQIIRKRYNNIGITIGAVLGGRKKK